MENKNKKAGETIMNISVHKSDIKGNTNVETIISLHDDMINNGKSEIDIKHYFKPDYIQHNPVIDTGADSVVKYFRSLSEKFPQKRIVVHHMIAVENWVWVHFNFFPTIEKADFGVRGLDIYRLDDDGKIAEHWDVSQQNADPAKALNSNGLF